MGALIVVLAGPHVKSFLTKWLCLRSRRSRRMKIAHRFIGGLADDKKSESVKRTIETLRSIDQKSY